MKLRLSIMLSKNAQPRMMRQRNRGDTKRNIDDGCKLGLTPDKRCRCREALETQRFLNCVCHASATQKKWAATYRLRWLISTLRNYPKPSYRQ